MQLETRRRFVCIQNTDQDFKLTTGVFHDHVKWNVMQQSSGSQTPELQGDKERLLVQCQ